MNDVLTLPVVVKFHKSNETKDECISNPAIKILIIGGTGSLGEMLIKKYYGTHHLIIFSRDENKHWIFKRKYGNNTYVIGDIRDYNSVYTCIQTFQPNIIIVASAMKHIDICEYNTGECIKTNILGIQNVVNSSLNLNPKYLNTVIFISTDKACSPVNVYGMCKSIGEKIIVEASNKYSNIKFINVRYGNVLNSRGSIIPKFTEIGKTINEVHFPVTDDRMTRYFMKLEQSVELIDNAIKYANTGETVIPILPSFKIIDLAALFSKIYNKPIIIVGIRPGEKIHECLINISELYKTEKRLLGNIEYYIIKPNNLVSKQILTEEYTSEKTLSIDKLKELVNI